MSKETKNELVPFFSTVKTAAVTVATKDLVPKKRLTLDTISNSKVPELLAQCTSELYIEEMPSKFHETGRAPATCVDVIDLMRGEEFMLICSAVLARSLARAGEPITGRYFAIKTYDVVAGKSYRKVDVTEFEVNPK